MIRHPTREEATRLVVALAAGVVLALPAAAPASHQRSTALPDLTDCGDDHRDWFDLQLDFDYPVTPPAAAEPALYGIGCPPEGEPRYGPGPFNPPRHPPAPPGADASYVETVPARLRLHVAPRRVLAGARVHFRIRTTWVADSARRRAAGIPVRLAGRRVVTDAAGRAHVTFRPRRAGTLRVTAYVQGRRAAGRTITVAVRSSGR